MVISIKWCVFYILLLGGCIAKSKQPKDKIYVELNNVVYDSVQVFVDSIIATNSQSKYYLLKYLEQNSDSMIYLITTLSQKAMPSKYKNCLYYYNKDSSLLLVEGFDLNLFEDLEVKNILSNNSKVKFSDEIVSEIFEPLVWKFSVVKGEIYIDKLYGKQNADIKVLEVEKFKP